MQIHLQPSKCKNYQSYFAVVYAKGLQQYAIKGLPKNLRKKITKIYFEGINVFTYFEIHIHQIWQKI